MVNSYLWIEIQNNIDLCFINWLDEKRIDISGLGMMLVPALSPAQIKKNAWVGDEKPTLR